MNGKATEHGTIHQQKGSACDRQLHEDAEGEGKMVPLVANPSNGRDRRGILQIVAE